MTDAQRLLGPRTIVIAGSVANEEEARKMLEMRAILGWALRFGDVAQVAGRS